MFKSGARVIACLGLLFFWPAEGLAWTDATRLRMVQDALKATPPALNTILERYREDLERGVIEPSQHEGEEVHYQHADGSAGLAAAGVVRKESEVRALLQEGRSLQRFAFEMGVLAHLISDVGFPLNASDADPREPLYREAYRAYIEKYLAKIPFVLETPDSEALESGNLLGYMMSSSRQAAEGYALIGPAFKDDGTPRTPAALDLRSVPFGIASLAYSRTVTDIVQVWRHLWASVHGDMEHTPFADAPPCDPAHRPGPPGRAEGAP
jgi:hypothetical protein